MGDRRPPWRQDQERRALDGVYLACLRDYSRILAPGERGTVILVACRPPLISGGELVPASLRTAGAVWTWTGVALGAGLIGALHVVIPHVHLFEERGLLDPSMLRASTLVALGLILHDFPEGIAMANAYIDSPALGVLVSLAIALHNVPEEFAMAVPAVATQRRTILFGMAPVSALAEPAGALVGLAVVQLAPALNALFIAVAAGAMIFVSVHELLPMAARFGNLPLFGAGLARRARSGRSCPADRSRGEGWTPLSSPPPFLSTCLRASGRLGESFTGRMPGQSS